jgi:xanthine dehydrogenase YagR molybdenum-binding subunit
LIQLALADAQSPFTNYKEEGVIATDAALYSKEDNNLQDTYANILRRNKLTELEKMGEFFPVDAKEEDKAKVLAGKETIVMAKHAAFTAYTFGAVFAEVKVNEKLGQVQVSRLVSGYGAGAIINQKTAQNQIMGGNTFGIGMCLMEDAVTDPHSGGFINSNLADYHVPVNADVPQIDAFFVEEEDTLVNALGAKGVGEVGVVGVAAAIANAVYHATGKRIRKLPITVDKLI